MKPKLNIEKSWRYGAIYLKGSRDWMEFGLGFQFSVCLRRVCVREDNSRCNSSSMHVRVLWYQMSLFLHL